MNRELIAAAAPLLWSMEPRAWRAMLAATMPRTAPAGGLKTERHDGVLTVELSGTIWRNPPPIVRMFLHVTDPDELAGVIMQAQGDDTVSAIRLLCDSPGGVIAGVPEAAAVVAQSEKPLTAHVTGICASAAFWIAAGADSIAARPSSAAGSIGAFSVFTDKSEMLERAGVRLDIFRSSELKGTGIDGSALTPAQRQYLQSGVDEVAAMFQSHVKAYRRAADEAFTGASFLGAKAKALGLVDTVANDVLATEAQPQARARVVATQHGAGLARYRLEQPDRMAEHEANGRRLVREGRAKVCATGCVSSWTREDFEQKGN